jgi:PAS domain S-box-containing protein
MDQLRSLFAELKREQTREFETIDQKVERTSQQTLTAIVLLCPLALVIVGVAVLFINRDLHKRELAEAKVEHERVVLSAVLDSLSEGVIVVDNQGRLVHFNPAAQRIHGQGKTESGSQHWSAVYGLYLPDTVTPFPSEQLPLVRALRGDRVVNAAIYQRLPSDLEGRWLSVTSGPMIDENGHHRGAVAVVHDVTDSRAAEERLKRSEEDYRELYDHAPCGYYAIDGDSLVLSMNATCLDWLGYDRHEVIGKLHLTDLLAPEDRDPFLDRFARFKESGSVVGVVQIFRRKDGSIFPTLLNAQ